MSLFHMQDKGQMMCCTYMCSRCCKISGYGVIAPSWGRNSPYYCITHPGATLLGLQGGDIQFYRPFLLRRCFECRPCGSVCAHTSVCRDLEALAGVFASIHSEEISDLSSTCFEPWALNSIEKFKSDWLHQKRLNVINGTFVSLWSWLINKINKFNHVFVRAVKFGKIFVERGFL